MKINNKLLYEDVEKPGIKYPPTASQEISTRYSFACQYIMSKDILEVGFGSGYGINALISKASSYHGIDYLKENVNFVQNKFQNKTDFNMKIEQGDAHNLRNSAELSDKSFVRAVGRLMLKAESRIDMVSCSVV